jgi:hypothetical protein
MKMQHSAKEAAQIEEYSCLNNLKPNKTIAHHKQKMPDNLAFAGYPA